MANSLCHLKLLEDVAAAILMMLLPSADRFRKCGVANLQALQDLSWISDVHAIGRAVFGARNPMPNL